MGSFQATVKRIVLLALLLLELGNHLISLVFHPQNNYFSCLVEVLAGDHERLLYEHLQHGYNFLARPVKNESVFKIYTFN